ncbi:geranylgeranyl diphosphate synthase [Streptomyces sp. CB01201]|uniref:polyprenyl synthetase family protein n=1 Tax=Streptomyces sp. CB01201 TaxID=2020324 RepID=UPI000C2781B5|nr:polyprenyl synthetase family protein [Streptomyces sp. CB01201]PJM97973.1 geranylgeranyl diphosphate synthase [Streptomyces sp. CB01201]
MKTARNLPTPPLDLALLRQQVETALDAFLTARASQGSTSMLAELATPSLQSLLRTGGKRIRPTLCVVGWHAAGGCLPAPQQVIQVAASLELFHIYAFIHDDVMDESDTRRGSPTLHCTLIAQQRQQGRSQAEAERIGQALAIMLGDLCLVWADEMIHTAGLTHQQLRATLTLLDASRTQTIEGQLLDLSSTGRPTADIDKALAVCRLKTAVYTIQHPLQTGATLAGAGPALRDYLTQIAFPLGEAFQLRDDLLGVFGDPDVTGKSRLDDLREGKHTALFALALRNGTAGQTRELESCVGRADLTEDQGARLREVLTDCGARKQVEQMIEQRYQRVMSLLEAPSAINPEALPHLLSLTSSLTRRWA